MQSRLRSSDTALQAGGDEAWNLRFREPGKGPSTALECHQLPRGEAHADLQFRSKVRGEARAMLGNCLPEEREHGAEELAELAGEAQGRQPAPGRVEVLELHFRIEQTNTAIERGNQAS